MNRSTIGLICALTALTPLLNACNSDSSSGNGGISPSTGGTLTEGVFRPRIPIITSDSPTPIASVFFAAAGSRYDDEEYAERFTDEMMRRAQIYLDAERVEWRPAVGGRLASLFAAEWIREISFASIGSGWLASYDSFHCDTPCTLRVYASPTVRFDGVTDTDLSWEAQPNLWLYTEVDFDPAWRAETNRLLEYDPDTMDAVAALLVMWIRIDGDTLTAEMGPYEIEGYNLAREYMSDGSDAGYPDGR